MLIEIHDAAHNTVFVNTDQITLVMIPSPLAPGDGQSKVFFGTTALVIPETDARRIVETMGVHTALLAARGN